MSSWTLGVDPLKEKGSWEERSWDGGSFGGGYRKLKTFFSSCHGWLEIFDLKPQLGCAHTSGGRQGSLKYVLPDCWSQGPAVFPDLKTKNSSSISVSVSVKGKKKNALGLNM